MKKKIVKKEEKKLTGDVDINLKTKGEIMEWNEELKRWKKNAKMMKGDKDWRENTKRREKANWRKGTGRKKQKGLNPMLKVYKTKKLKNYFFKLWIIIRNVF